MSIPDPSEPAEPRPAPAPAAGRPGDAEIVALLLGELRGAAAAARQRGATTAEVLAVVEQRRRVLRQSSATQAPDMERDGRPASRPASRPAPDVMLATVGLSPGPTAEPGAEPRVPGTTGMSASALALRPEDSEHRRDDPPGLAGVVQ